jgi:hypothetical protein
MSAPEWLAFAALYAASVYAALCAIDAYRAWRRK